MFALNKTLNFKIIQSWPNFVSLFTLIRKRVYNLFLRHFSRDSSLHGLPHKTRFPASCKLQPPHSKTTFKKCIYLYILSRFTHRHNFNLTGWHIGRPSEKHGREQVERQSPDGRKWICCENAKRTAVVWTRHKEDKNAYFHSPQPWLSSPSVHSTRRISRDPWWTAAACTPDTFTPRWVTTEIEISRS